MIGESGQIIKGQLVQRIRWEGLPSILPIVILVDTKYYWKLGPMISTSPGGGTEGPNAVAEESTAPGCRMPGRN
jgi:hypothetical protein